MEHDSGGRMIAIADDLSGAAETAIALGVRGSRSVVVLGAAEVDAPVVVLDLDTRTAPPAAAAGAVRAALGRVRPGDRLFKKIDSLLRGNIAAEIAALTDHGYGVALTPALPVAHRVVREGVLSVDGVPLADSDAWRAERAIPPRTVRDAVGEAELLALSVVRDSAALAEAFTSAVVAKRVVICDAETDADLEAIARAAREVPGLALAGSGGLAAAIGRLQPAVRDDPGSAAGESGSPAGPVLIVAGTAAPVAIEQIARLTGVTVRSLDPDTLAAGGVDVPPPAGVTVLRVDPAARLDPRRGPAVAAGLARSAVAALAKPGAERTGLVVLGGETARRALDALGVDRLEPIEEIHHGAVLSRLPGGRLVVTRPGSFGGPDSLVQIVRALRTSETQPTAEPAGLQRKACSVTPSQPVIAITMGDGAGIGPEVVVPAIVHPDTLAVCRPVVIGDAKRLRQAADIMGVDADIVPVTSPSDAEPGAHRISVIDLDLLPADLPWGELSAAAGEAAYQYIRTAADLAQAGAVHGICTAPLNKEALHAAGHRYPGHTELLAHLTGVDEVSMMLSTPKVKVIHVTTHIGLIDAIARIEPGLVERTVRRGHEALVRAGNPAPVIGVCGINPHAGENGLFGYGEEEEKIVPALESLRAQGIDARGPLPADTAFFLAGRGDYDLIVAMYHDQGHGPVKVLGIEAGVNLTVGLPVIRTSVDHGTAFDIAGTGKADPRSMVEALRQAAELATQPGADRRTEQG
ncbi:4-hydroxythreonine-4-phosphate dehydrogenase PdxA [Amycolatopsis thermoflava]|uniref:4-hydroxythreonine-4-phosphate dehydrogenase PdxA n=1 Tax=Amycolatopsis thermoflava TaxID=84480 RepID=UPI003D717EA3